MEDDLIYSDEEDDDEDDVPSRPNRALEPHPQIKQLTDEVSTWFHLFVSETEELI